VLASVVFDAISVLTAGPSILATAYWMLTAGIVGGLVAAPFGLIDLLAIPDHTRARRIGHWYAGGNMIVLRPFIARWFLRPSDEVAPSLLAIALSLLGASLVLMTAWMGGEPVSRLGIGVSPQANPDASSSVHGPVRTPLPADPTRRSNR
jgi:uncharacterized membrane protein